MKNVLFLINIYENNQYSSAMMYWYGILEKLGYNVYYEDYNEYNPDKFYQLIKDNKPDYIFHPTHRNIHTEFLKLREFSKVYLLHSDDDWRYDNYKKFWIPYVDGAIGTQNTKQTYINDGASENYYVRTTLGFNPNTMVFDYPINKTHDIVHMGGLHGGREESINFLQSKGVVVSLPFKGTTPPYQDYLKCYNDSKISLCFTNNSVMTKKQNKGRAVEILFYSVLASEEWPDMEIMDLEPNVDFILLDYSNTKYLEMFEKVLNDDKFREQMFLSGKRKLLATNTVFHRWNVIMKEIDEDYKPIDVNKILGEYGLI